MVPNHPSRIRSQSPVQRRLNGIFAGLVLAFATARQLPAVTLHGRADIQVHAATRAAAGRHKVQLQPSRIEQKIAEDKRELALEENRLDVLLHSSTAGTRGNANSPDSPEALTVRELRAQLTEKRRHLAELEENYTDLYPDVITTREEITDLQSKLEQAQAAVHFQPAPASRVQTAAGREQELAQIRAAIEQRTRELAGDEATASRRDEPQPLRPSGKMLARHSFAPSMQQDAAAAAAPAVVPEPPSTPIAVAPVTQPASAARGTSTGRRIVVLLLITLGILSVAGGLMVLLRTRSKSQVGILQDSAQLRALLPDVMLIGSIPKMKPQ